MFTCHDISEDEKGDQGGGPKMAKISGGVKNQDFVPLLRPKKCFKQLKNGVGPKLTKKSGGVKPDIFKRAAQKWPKMNMG